MTNAPTRRLALAALASLPLLASAQAPTEAWPTRPVKIIVPFTAGGPTDTIARLLAQQLQETWKQTVLVDYKAGAGTTVGMNAVAKAPADGYTLGMAISAFTINPSLMPNMPYDTLKDLVGVSQVAQAHFGLFAYPAAPFNTMPELIAYAKANPGKLSYATPGAGTGTHLAGEMLSHMAGIKMVHVPYKGSAPAQLDVVGGRVPLLFDVLFSSMPFVKDGRMKVIALSSPARAAANPEIPLIQDTVPGFSAMSFIGVVAPAGLPPALLRKISADIAAAVRSHEVSTRMAALGMEPVGSTSEQYNASIRTEIDKWARVIKTSGIKLE
ncbi:tripartite tricarboxylate transporter substrate binding protein [Caenimonas terrae]|uniref:Tripartite tricarboxylate transporter substrate binding protein n=1 Tax=Caenimonas terrae TaxID=696074 RepID=A0ABW0N9Q2_9BURK